MTLQSKGHLNNPTDVEEFANEMMQQLQKHTRDKTSLLDWNPINVYELCISELNKRLDIIKTQEPSEIKKQTIHMANYLFFMWYKIKELDHWKKCTDDSCQTLVDGRKWNYCEVHFDY